MEGKIALANYGGIYRGTKVKNAQENGLAGCIIFTDPLDDGEVTEENGYEAYPSKPTSSLSVEKPAHSIQMALRGTLLRFKEAVSGFPQSILETLLP